MINGPESFTPDGNFILGAAPECANMYVGAGFNAFGIAAAGGAGWALAEWAMRGEAPLDLWVVDIRRFSALHRDRDWVNDRTLEAYGKHYTVAFPHEEYETGRNRIVSPLYDRLKARGAVFGSQARLGTAQLVRAAGRRAARYLLDGPAELVRPGRRRASPRPREGRPVRPVVLRQIRSDAARTPPPR